MSSRLTFDRVLIGAGPEPRLMTAKEFLGLPLPERVALILKREAQFFDGAATVDPRVALGSLRREAVEDPPRKPRH
jgi:hypothetical protein